MSSACSPRVDEGQRSFCGGELSDIPAGSGGHAVRFYDGERELAQTVGRYLADALGDGAVAVVIATERHQAVFEAELEAAGIDVEDAHEQGILVSLDAAATIAKLMGDGRIDAHAFGREVGEVMREAGSTGKPVCAYGEMVALLWEAGNVPGAIELEELWNDLGRELRFSLLCGYPTESVSGPDHAKALRQVCQLHSTVMDTNEVSGRFPPKRQSPGAARHMVSGALRQWGYDDALRGDAELVCSELATNAVVHTRNRFSVVLRRERSGVRISVRDESPATPHPRDESATATSGRGLRLVALLARRWGVDPADGGKTVWADL